MSAKAAVLLSLSIGACAAHGQANAPRELAATCAACHGTEGRSVTKEVPPLAGMAKTSLAESMRAFRAGARGGTVMPQIAKGYDDRQIELIADYFARRAP
jgi:sulfide dehydrogenase cytochrome subunit